MHKLLKTISTCSLLFIIFFTTVTVSAVSGETSASQNPQALSSTPRELLIMTGEWPPFVSSELPEYGFTSEIIREASRAAGLTVSIQFAPWTRCEAAVKHGKAFASFPYSANDARVEFAFFSESIARSRSVFFYNKSKMQDFNFFQLNELTPYLIGGVRGYYYEPLFTKVGLSIDYSDTEEDALKKLFHERVDLLPLNELVGWEMIRMQYPKQREKFDSSNTAVDEQSLNLMVSRTHPDSATLLKRFNEGLSKIIDNGVYQAILEKHNVPRAVSIKHD